jgi:hypothetical protein
MAQGKAISGNLTKNKGATVLGAGAVDGRVVTNAILLTTNNAGAQGQIGSRVFLAVSPASSGNTGTKTAITGNFAKMVKGQYLIPGYSQQIAGVANTILSTPAADWKRTNGLTLVQIIKYQRLDITSWNAVTGVATKGVNAGSTVSLAVDKAAQETTGRLPAGLVYMVTGLTPTQDNYKVMNSI